MGTLGLREVKWVAWDHTVKGIELGFLHRFALSSIALGPSLFWIGKPQVPGGTV